jgi:MYXO-CTERM domain-containing protein
LNHAGSIVAALSVVSVAVGWTTVAHASECDAPESQWLACEDFEDGEQGWSSWFEQSAFVECNGCPDGQNDPARIRLANDEAHDGQWSLHMPAEASAGYRGASLTWRSCDGEKQPGCSLTGYEQLYWRAWVKLGADHQYVHHFMSIAGTRPDQYWGADGTAGCRPNGQRAAGTTVDFDENHGLFFYTYFPEMTCDSGGYCSGDYVQQICDDCSQKGMPCTDGLECCWGNHFSADPRPVLERDRWVCLEMMQRLNTPGESDGEMAFWVDGELGHRQTGMHWRDVSELQLNKVWVQHYIAGGDAEQSNRIWWDDVIVSTARIGCGGPPSTNNATNNATNNQSSTNNDTTGEDPVTAGPNPPGDDQGAGGGCGCTAAGPAGSIPGLLLLIGWIASRRSRRRSEPSDEVFGGDRRA